MTILVNHSCVQDLPKNTRTGPVVLALTCSPKEDSSPLDAPDGSDEPTGCGIHAWSRHKKNHGKVHCDGKAQSYEHERDSQSCQELNSCQEFISKKLAISYR